MIALVFKHERAAAPGNKQVIVLVLVSHGKTEEIFFWVGKGAGRKEGFWAGLLSKLAERRETRRQEDMKKNMYTSTTG